MLVVVVRFSGRKELELIPRLDFDIVSSILKVLEGWELGNRGLYKKYWSHKKTINISKNYFGPGSPKKRFLRFSKFITRKNPEYGNLE